MIDSRNDCAIEIIYIFTYIWQMFALSIADVVDKPVYIYFNQL